MLDDDDDDDDDGGSMNVSKYSLVLSSSMSLMLRVAIATPTRGLIQPSDGNDDDDNNNNDDDDDDDDDGSDGSDDDGNDDDGNYQQQHQSRRVCPQDSILCHEITHYSGQLLILLKTLPSQ